MFNQKASDQERHKTLQELIKKDYQAAGENSDKGEGDSDSDKDATEENEFFTDEQLNEVIARDDAEFELF